uniref:cysteine peptidase family C39 domain-containing protein n=1 Tax=Chamaesiphon sp. VAR_69_metabat_338 TaxID=2964704 RepID=UPI00286E0FEE
MNDRQTLTSTDIQTFLQPLAPFDRLSPDELQAWASKMQPLRFRMGQKISLNTQLPDRFLVIFSGKIRLVGSEPNTNKTISLQVLESGGMLGSIGLIRKIPCETALASEETICFALSATDFTDLLYQHPAVADGFKTPHRAEVFDLMTRYFQHQNLGLPTGKALAQLTERVWQDAVLAVKLPDSLAIDRFWFDSLAPAAEFGVPIPLDREASPLRNRPVLSIPESSSPPRLIGLSARLLDITAICDDAWAETSARSAILIDYAPELDVRVTNNELTTPPSQIAVAYRDGKFPTVLGRGIREEILACFQMISLYLGIKYRRETVQRIVDLQLERNGKVTLQPCAGIAEALGLMGRLMDIPANQICRIQNPALIAWEDSFAVIYQANDKEIVLGTPQSGVEKIKIDRFISLLGDAQTSVQILLLLETKNIQRQKFDLAWFIPYLKPEWKVLVEVLIASFFVQILGLANPLLVQVIIDRVLGQNSPSTLAIFGILLIVVALFENILTS